MEPFKSLFSPTLVRDTAHHAARLLPGFDASGFEAAVLARLNALELKARAQLIADELLPRLPGDPAERARVLMAMLHPSDFAATASIPAGNDGGLAGWAVMPLTLVVGQHGLDDFDGGLAALREMTKRFSAEFAIRHFLLADQDRALAVMAGWLVDPNQHVRRLVSEGTRPRLPWAMRLPRLIDDPGPALPLLEALRDDPSDYVRRSVANHLNDIARDHPGRLTALAADWMTDASPARRALLRHALRGRIKAGDPAALAVFGHAAPQLEAGPLLLSGTAFRMGEEMEMRIDLRSTAEAEQRLTVDYVLHLMKANGRTAPKVFKGASIDLAPGATARFRRIHRFREVTTRRFYPGRHAVQLRINGQDSPPVEFDLA